MALCKDNLTQAFIHTDRLTHNLGVLQRLVGSRPLWPAIKANAYGHGIDIVARHLVGLGYNTLLNSKCWQEACVVRKSDASPWIRA
jgi:alanine racemase